MKVYLDPRGGIAPLTTVEVGGEYPSSKFSVPVLSGVTPRGRYNMGYLGTEPVLDSTKVTWNTVSGCMLVGPFLVKCTIKTRRDVYDQLDLEQYEMGYMEGMRCFAVGRGLGQLKTMLSSHTTPSGLTLWDLFNAAMYLREDDQNLMAGLRMAVEGGLCTQEQLNAILEAALD